ncbi:cAMP-dependent protein kinase catalytic subunit, putative [Pediculus humanus corporis]|uniref:cAMP-dependent protein kinase catalytic subunit, putative n=1 Tax=Pediculus humanus subsp. corporis TaxID=121224 RepID=E0VUJ8_PEDHC|nr:cAMP-dependent protein kinase catalytic subunit, putative [Pediculus humanus corporis]EEB17054.1 cAMP-dependent protein kinase catalytic subunit, putative [Pediculus humanus corporis]
MSDQELGQSVSEEVTLNSRGYRLVKKLGEGSYAKVYLSEYHPVGTNQSSTEHKTQLACKIIDTTKAPRDFVRKFLPRELDILVKLNHPHIIHVHSIFQRRSKYFIFMRFAENGDLLDFVLKNGAIVESQARVWLRQMALGLQYLHELEIAHRDLKCENILITSNYNVKLADFGFARYVVDSKGRRILSETYCGSLSYAAPEILRGTPYNPKISDLWSLGVILYIMLNKAMPFDDTNIKRLYEQQTSRKWKFRAKVENILTDQAKKLVTLMLEPDVTKRLSMYQILNSDWIAMDPRLMVMTPAERMAKTESLHKGPSRYKSEDKQTDEVVVIKIAGQPTGAPSRNINV